MISYFKRYALMSLPLLSIFSCTPTIPTIGSGDLSGEDFYERLGFVAQKFSFALLQPCAITCWVEAYDPDGWDDTSGRGVMEPQEVIRVDVPLALKKGDVVISLGAWPPPAHSVEDIQINLSVGAYKTTPKKGEQFRVTNNQAIIKNFVKSGSAGPGRHWHRENVEIGKEIVLWRLFGEDRTLILKIKLSPSHSDI